MGLQADWLPFKDLAETKVYEFLKHCTINTNKDLENLVFSSSIGKYFCLVTACYFGFLTLLYGIRSTKRALDDNSKKHNSPSIFGSVISTAFSACLTTGLLFGYSFSTILYDRTSQVKKVADFAEAVLKILLK